MVSEFSVERPIWLQRLEASWELAPIAWLAGVRRAGKTTLSRAIPDSRYLNCDLPSVQELLRKPEELYASISQRVVVLDEIHQLDDPSLVLKIAADEYPHLRILATGSSTVAATTKFRDALTGRKRTVHLVPVLYEELPAFDVEDLDRRLRYGGLPPMLLGKSYDPSAYAEWLDSFFARDVQELFRVEKRTAFLKLCELLLRQSGGVFEVASLARDAAISRPTVAAWTDALEIMNAVTFVRPHHGGGARELLARPKVYAFDTGFACYARHWDRLRDDDRGILWEHLVLETLQSLPIGEVRFWRDKDEREIDFVIPRARDACDVIECKWNASASFNPRNLTAFRAAYPKGKNYVVSPRRAEPATREEKGFTVTYIGLDRLRDILPPAP